jgi:very-short-patch-repair endonuclease
MTRAGYIAHGMRTPCSPHARERQIAALAGRQHGVVAYRQLQALGFGRGAIGRRVSAGRLHRVHFGVYAVGHRVVSLHGRWMAAVLACGDLAVLSHRDAAALHGIRRDARPSVDVSAPRSRRPREGITLHRPVVLERRDRTRVDGIPVTTLDRTLLDLATVVGRRQLERAYEEADRLQLLDVRAVERQLARAWRRPGSHALRMVVQQALGWAETRSELERRFLRLCRSASLPRPAVNSVLAGFEVDMAWPPQRLVVELDGFGYHRTRAAFERDRLRDARLQVAGFRVLRITQRRLETEPERVVAELRALLGSGAGCIGHA